MPAHADSSERTRQGAERDDGGKRYKYDALFLTLDKPFSSKNNWGAHVAWTHASANVRQFTGKMETVLPVPCTYDLNVAATKYFYALDNGEIRGAIVDA